VVESANQNASLEQMLSLGIKALGEFLVKQNQEGGTTTKESSSKLASFVGKNEETGQSELRIPMPGPQVVEKAVELLNLWLKGS
jgi:hypothetical protein